MELVRSHTDRPYQTFHARRHINDAEMSEIIISHFRSVESENRRSGGTSREQSNPARPKS